MRRSILVALIALGLTFLLAKPRPKSHCPDYSFLNKVSSFHKYSGKPATIKGVKYPRNIANSGLHYRGVGTPHQYDVRKIALALLGEESGAVGSKFFDSMRATFQGQAPLIDVSGYLMEGSVSDQYQEVMACITERGYMSEYQATRFAQDITDRYFNNLGDTAVDLFIGGQYGYARDWPGAVIFSSVYHEATNAYGGYTLVVRDQKPRTVDINFRRFRARDDHWAHIKSGDYGEAVTPGYIKASDIEGLILKSGRGPHWSYINFKAHFEPKPIETALFRVTHKGEDFIAVLEGQGQNCILKDPTTQKFYYCDEDYDWRNRHAKLPLLNRSPSLEVPLLGLVRLCKPKTPCTLSKAVRNHFKKVSKASPPLEVLHGLRSVATQDGRKAYFFPAQGDGKPLLPPGTIRVRRAVYGGNLLALPADEAPDNAKDCLGESPKVETLEGISMVISALPPYDVSKKASKFCDGRVQCRYRIHPRYIGDPAYKKPKSFYMEYDCVREDGSISKQVTEALPPPTFKKVLTLNCLGEAG